MFYTLSKKLEEKNIACIRFDFSGHGESDFSFEALRIDRLFTETKCVLEYAKKQYTNIHLLGFSMGGVIALNTELEHCASLTLIAPALNIETIVKQLLASEKKLDANSVDLQVFRLHKDFLTSLSPYQLSNIPI